MTISTITIATVDYVAYASIAEADPRLAVDPVRAATWAALSTDQKGAKLVAATFALDYLAWTGAKTGGDSQPNKWARTGVTYASGGAVSTTEVPLGVQDATILMAGTIAIDEAAADKSSSGSNIKEVKAGTTGVSFFRATSGVPLSDESAYALVQEFLASSAIVSDTTGSMVSGNDCESSFSDIDEWGVTTGFP